MAENIAVVSLGIVQNDNHVLLIERREKTTDANGEVLSWAFPGGKAENDETPMQTVVREVEEETGVLVEAQEVIDERRHPDFPAYITYIACRLIDDEQLNQVSDSGIVTSKWVSLSNITDYIKRPINDKVRDYLDL